MKFPLWPRVPARPPAESSCLVCGCTEKLPCPGGCAWEHLDLEGNWGLCTSCAENLLCPLGERLAVEAVEGQPYRPRLECPCPICRAVMGSIGDPRKRRGPVRVVYVPLVQDADGHLFSLAEPRQRKAEQRRKRP